MAHPEYRVFSAAPPPLEGRLTPVYPTTRGLSQARLRGLTAQLQDRAWPEDEAAPYRTLLYLTRPPAGATDKAIEAAQERIARTNSPPTTSSCETGRNSAPNNWRAAAAFPAVGQDPAQEPRFRTDRGARRVVTEVLNNLTETVPMLRLLQGDVGSGKTVVAAFAAVRAAEHQAQTALMAPTEILAEQHYLSFSGGLHPSAFPWWC